MDQCEPSEPNTSTVQMQVVPDPEVFGKHTTKLLKRIIRKIEEDKQIPPSSAPFADPVSRTARYTGLHKDAVEKMLGTEEPLQINHIDIDRQLVHNKLISMYRQNEYIPTVVQLFNEVKVLLPDYADIDYFKRILIKMGYVMYKYPGQKVLRVMEKKSVTFEKYRFLKSVQQYRKDNVPIVYIGIASMNDFSEFLNLEKSLRKNEIKGLHRVLFTATENKIDHIDLVFSISFEVIQKWLTSVVLHDVPQGCVIILEDSKIFHKVSINVPNVYSVKLDIVEWLREHYIPCNIDMSKSELIDLVENCTDTTENTCIINNIVKSYNNTLLKLPLCINGLSIPALLLRFLNDKKITCTNKAIKKTLNGISEEQLKIFSDCIAQEEKRLLEEEMKVDNDLDEFVKNTKKNDTLHEENGEDDTTVPTFSDSE